MNKALKFFCVFLLFTFLGVPNVNALQESGAGSSEEENQIDILGKVSNHYYWDLSPIGGKLELPRIFLYNSSLFAYSSTTSAINSGDGFTDEYYLEHDTKTKNGKIKPVSYHVVPKEGHMTMDLSISTHLLFFWFSALLTLLIFGILARRYKKGIGRDTAPKGAFHNMFEVFFIFIRDDVARPGIPGDHYKRFVPYLASAFFFIAFMNLLGLVPWGTSSTADITVTASMALMTFIITQVNGSKDHWKHVFWFPGVPLPVKFIMMPIEFIGLFTKPFALAIRLFANMLSGKVLVYSVIGLIFIFANLFGATIAYSTSIIWVLFSVFIYIIKAFVALLQAYIFVMLSALFIGMAMESHEDHGEHENEEEEVYSESGSAVQTA